MGTLARNGLISQTADFFDIKMSQNRVTKSWVLKPNLTTSGVWTNQKKISLHLIAKTISENKGK